jgi:hypothetical protein
MELFIPSLVAIILAALIVMFLLPRLSPIILGVIALVFLVLAAYQHFTFFGNEYANSTWQLPLVTYGPYLLLGGLVLFLIFFIVNFIGTGSTEVTAPIQKMNEAVNRVAEQATEAAKTTTNNAMKAMGLGNNAGNGNAAPRPPNVNRPNAGNYGPNFGRQNNGPRFSRI